MAKIHRRKCLTSSELLVSSEKLETRANDPKDPDHPDWLRRRAEGIRIYALRKENKRVMKADERRKERRAKHSI